ncbi:peroxisomal d3,d2-enoyl-CoA isomerase [Gonapodya prolifera JEL478]|uniref:Peroxisomal d3,d2-enoyl-CoA isomerase n=1 Tax=Gonapodya prolifera (strain JEL478) TaxID=1344416 RepID=A0A139A9K7_GONPJ|nr:peroxisomal d3,d2-enoyl-CoA isomerase [Gonapodya prolifera JEL478]|eukprot:KXS13364.1 peroxisomal d3,d2-enoyl-CoA isomerase [Gonapodya prolifera JEL478]
MAHAYQDIIVSIDGKIATIKLNRPKSLNALSPPLIHSLIRALEDLANNKDTVVTVITGEGRFFSAGVDLKAGGAALTTGPPSPLESTSKSIQLLGEAERLGWVELVGRMLINHPKVLVFALNGPVVGITAAWTAYADLILASDTATLHLPFSNLGLVPEGGCAQSFSTRMGWGRAVEVVMFGRKATAQELHQWGFVNQIFPSTTFSTLLHTYLTTHLSTSAPIALLTAKKLLRDVVRADFERGNVESVRAMGVQATTGETAREMGRKRREMEAKSKSKI